MNTDKTGYWGGKTTCFSSSVTHHVRSHRNLWYAAFKWETRGWKDTREIWKRCFLEFKWTDKQSRTKAHRLYRVHFMPRTHTPGKPQLKLCMFMFMCVCVKCSRLKARRIKLEAEWVLCCDQAEGEPLRGSHLQTPPAFVAWWRSRSLGPGEDGVTPGWPGEPALRRAHIPVQVNCASPGGN